MCAPRQERISVTPALRSSALFLPCRHQQPRPLCPVAAGAVGLLAILIKTQYRCVPQLATRQHVEEKKMTALIISSSDCHPLLKV